MLERSRSGRSSFAIRFSRPAATSRASRVTTSPSVAQTVESSSFRSFEVYFVVLFFYLAISWIMTQIFNAISTRYFSYPVK